MIMRATENSINEKICIQCCRCVGICPAKHLELIGGRIVELEDEALACIHCAHCMSVCPTQAIIIKGYDYTEFEDLPDIIPGLDKFEVLLKSRRSCRSFQDKPVPREIIEKIIEIASLAPVSIPSHRVEILVLDTGAKVAELQPSLVKTIEQWDSMFSNPVGKFIMRFMMSSDELAQMQFIIPLIKGVVHGKDIGKDYVTYNAPAMLLFHASRREDSFEENCILAKTYAMIAAEGLGLGTCIIGWIPPIFKNNKKLKKQYSIPDENDVVGCLILGYPVSTHNRAIRRDFRSVRWV